MAGNWETVRSSSPSTTIPSVPAGSYEVEVVAIDAFGNRSISTNSQQTIDRIGVGALEGGGIETVRGAAVTALSSTLALLTWTPPLTTGFRVSIRHTPDASGGAWGAANPITPELPLASDQQVQVPALSGCYLLRFVNEFGLLSGVTASAAFSAPFVGATLSTLEESAGGFAGIKSNCIFDSSLNGLRFNSEYWDDLGLIGSLPLLIDSYGVTTADGLQFDGLADDSDFDGLTDFIDTYGVDGQAAYYTFSSGYDAGAVTAVELRRLVRSYARVSISLWDSRIALIDDWAYLEDDDLNASGGEVAVEYRLSGEPLSSAVIWTEWAPLTCCAALARAIQFRARLTIQDENQDVVVTTLGAIVSKTAAATDFLPIIFTAATITYAATVDLDMAALAGGYRTISLTGALTFTTSSRASGRQVTIRLVCDSTTRTLTFPVGWVFLGNRPAEIAASKVGVLSVTFFGTSDADCLAAYAAQL